MINFWEKLDKGFVCLAPLAGISDSPFRQICKEFGADVLYSEMISAAGLIHGGSKTLKLCHFEKDEKPIVIQLFGSNPKYFKKAVKIIEEKVKPDGIDINMGCPARKVMQSDSGAVLMQKPEIAVEVVKAVCESTKLPVSIKLRAKTDEFTALDIVKKLKDFPLSAVAIHGRTLKQEFSGPIDFEVIEKVKKFTKSNFKDCVVIGNGGINGYPKHLEMLQKSKCDGTMIGQHAFGNPWIFKSIKGGADYNPTFKERKAMALRHAKLFIASNRQPATGKAENCRLVANGQRRGCSLSTVNCSLIPMRKHLAWYFKGMKNAAKLRQRLVRVGSIDALDDILREANRRVGE